MRSALYELCRPVFSLKKYRKVPLQLQTQTSECGVCCILMILEYLGINETPTGLKANLKILEGGYNFGLSAKSIIDGLAFYGVTAGLYKYDSNDHRMIRAPSILHWNKNHFVVFTGHNGSEIYVNDPAEGAITLEIENFEASFSKYVIEIEGVALSHDSSKRFSNTLTIKSLLGRTDGLYDGISLIFLFGILLQFINICFPIALQLAVDNGILVNDMMVVHQVIIFLVLLLVVQIATTYSRDKIAQHFSFGLSEQLSNKLFRYLIRLPTSFFMGRSSADLASRFKSFDNVRRFVTGSAVALLMDAIMVVGLLVAMTLYSPILALMTLCFTVLYFLWRVWSHRHILNADQERIVTATRESAYFLESVDTIPSQKAFGLEDVKESRWSDIIKNSIKSQTRLNNWQIRNKIINQFLIGIDNVSTLYITALLIDAKTFSIGMFFAFTAFKIKYSVSIERLIETLFEFRLLSVHLSRLSDITQREADFINEDSPAIVSIFNSNNGAKEINLVNAAFKFSQEEPFIFKNITLTIHRGESTVITGQSGIGKSTLIKCMVGLLPLSEGSVIFDGVEVSNIRDFPCQIGVILQDDELLEGSILENISCFSKQPNRSVAMWACNQACLLEDLDKFPYGLESPVGIGGKSLSCGQRQRLLLARALYRKPSVIFLDEAFSNLNEDLEDRIDNNLKLLGITRVSVTHRSHAISKADKVFVLN